MPHETEDRLELYALGRLDEQQTAAVEEHLLVCPVCQDRLDDVESFAVGMAQAIASEPPERPQGKWLSCFRRPARVWVPAFAALLLAAGLWFGLGGNGTGLRHVAPLATLQLTAVRGGVPSIEQARETEITLSDVSPEVTLRAEMVDSAGSVVWSGLLQGARVQGSVELNISRKLDPDTYFVRLFDGTGKLLHEYGFRVRAAL